MSRFRLKFWGIISVIVAIIAMTALPGAASAATAGQGAHDVSAPRFPQISQVPRVNLHAGFERLAGHVAIGPENGVVPAVGTVIANSPGPRAKSTAPAAAACAEPECNLIYNGGPVQHSPKIYVVFWGPLWETDAGAEAAANYLLNFYQGLGTGTDTWSTITSQYADGTGAPTFTGPVFGAAENDTSTPPGDVTPEDLAVEAENAYGGSVDLSNAEVVVASQSGTCFSDGFDGSCGTIQGTGYCAWHDAAISSAGDLSFTNLPYLLDAGVGCGEDWLGGTLDGFSTVGGHEYAESVTDPDGNAWRDTGDTTNDGGGEIGDKCAWAEHGAPAGQITLSGSSFAVQSLWDNASGACRLSPVAPPPPPAATTVTTSLAGGTKTGAVITVPSGTAVRDSATLAGANAATATGTVTYTVYSDAACSTVAAAGAAQAIGTPGTLPSSKAVTLSTARTYYWKASYSGDANNAASASTCGPAGEVETVTASPPPPPAQGPSVDKIASALGKTSVSAGITTTANSDLLVAYVAGRGPGGKAQAAPVTAGRLKWTLVSRSAAGRGDAEVWYARAAGKLSKLKVTATLKYAGYPVAITVIAYKSATGIGRHALAHASKGAPAGSLTTSHAGSWVFAAGDDWAKTAQRTPGAGQLLVHQTGDRAGDTYWVQATKRATKAAGTKVTINDIKPGADPYNLVLVEIL